MTGVAIRAAVEEDLPAVTRLLRPAMEARQVLPRTDDEVRELLGHAFVAEQEGTLVGFAAVEVYSKKLAELQCLVVSAARQGEGLGCRLIEACVACARELGVKELMAITASESLFERCGFHYSLPGQKKALFITP